jgi:glycosyltransferase involved in cell wall biosynthesis
MSAAVRVALVHDWLVAQRGGERVLEAIAQLYPEAELFTLLYAPKQAPRWVSSRRVHTSFLNRLPGVKRRYRHLLPLFPWAIESLDLRGFDLVLSSSHCVAKGVRIPASARHLAYVHAPMRYMWDRFDDYFGPGRASGPVRVAARTIRPWMQRWDWQSASRVHRFVANSRYIAGRIAEYYGRPASVLYPPVDLRRFTALPLNGGGQGGYFLWVGAFAPYKRLDLVLTAFKALGAPLWVAGSGQEESLLSQGLPPNIRVLGQVPDEELPALYRDARALVFAAEEDFGLTPLEAQACGRPVIAFARGGALETVTPETGVFFREQTVPALVQGVKAFDAFEGHFHPEAARSQANLFSPERFREGFLAEVAALLPPQSDL